MNKLIKLKEYLIKILTKKKTFEFYYNTGIDFFAKQDWENAIKFFKIALDQDDVKPQVYYNLALTYQSIKDYDRALTTYQKFLELNPIDYDGLYNIALVYFMMENFSKSIEFFEKCIEIRHDKDCIKSLILSYLSNHEIKTAVDFSQNIIENEQDGISLYYEIARVFENKNTLSKDFTLLDIAIGMYEKLIEKSPDFMDAYLSVSICYAKKGEYEKSVESCKKALEKNPKSYEANNQMGLVLYCRNDIRGAIEYYEEALKLKPTGDYKVYSNLAYAYEKIGKNDNAIKIFSQLLQKFPDFPAKNEIKNHLRILKTT